MTFIEAIILIDKYKDRGYKLCSDSFELCGLHPCLCVYKNNEFIGKLRWSRETRPAHVDLSLILALKDEELI